MRIKDTVAIVSRDFRLFYKIKSAIENYVDYLHLHNQDDLTTMDLIITDSSEFNYINHHNIAVIQCQMHEDTIRSIVFSKLRKNEPERICIVGIDPGKTTGMAIFLNNDLINTTICFSLEMVLDWVANSVANIPYDRLVIKIGTGEKSWFNKILEPITFIYKDIAEIIEVDESHTSVKRKKRFSIHENAAMIIAKRS
ncbi:MAG: hypothetical protein INQ03_07320 [Candidatus Heimdallarchaeota archaeon]|nr:hypothetical protein [Candidatus Heimdallarchaeota archaeon]